MSVDQKEVTFCSELKNERDNAAMEEQKKAFSAKIHSIFNSGSSRLAFLPDCFETILNHACFFICTRL